MPRAMRSFAGIWLGGATLGPPNTGKPRSKTGADTGGGHEHLENQD
jgi:hypothetical protein